jgi:hypothetical protein
LVILTEKGFQVILYHHRLDTEVIGPHANIAFLFDEDGKKIYELGYES